MISYEPLFGLIKKRLEPTIRAYFSLEDFQDTSLIQFAYQNIEQVVDYQHAVHNLDLAEVLVGTNLRGLFLLLKDRVFQLIKALLLEKRIIVFSLTPSVVSTFLLSLLALLPGALYFNLYNKATVL